MIFSDEDVAKGMKALGTTREAQYLRQWLAKRLLMVLSEAADVRALSIEHGRRLLAGELLQAIETPESADARDDLASHVHKPRRPVEYDARSRRRVPDTAPDDRAAELARSSGRLGSVPRRSHRADRRLAPAEADQA
jgi:hypothetical protein